MAQRHLAIALAVLLAGTAAAAPPTVSDEVILKFRAGAGAGARRDLLDRLGAVRTTPLGRSGALLVRLGAPQAAASVARHSHDPDLAYIEPNYVYEAEAVPNESWFSQQWALLNTGQTGGTPGADINATAAWDLATGLPSVVIAILDSGIDFGHPDLAANIYVNPGEVAGNGLDDDGNGYVDDVHGWDFVNEDNDPQDDNGHGTFMAGIIGAEANNGQGIAGVCWRVSLLPLKFLGATGTGTTADAIRALDYAVALGVPITNNSWGGGPFSQALLDAITTADQAGTAFVATAGGAGRDLDVTPVYPVCYDVGNVVAVAASDHDDLLYSASDYGDETVDLAAPGVGILTTDIGASYRTISGTSAATAHVSGALGLILTRFPLATGVAAGDHLVAHAEKVAALTGFVRMGRLDAYAALVNEPSAVPEAHAGRGLALWRESTATGEVRFGLRAPRDEHVRLAVFDVRGQFVRELFAGPLAGGERSLAWDAHDDRGARVASGVYVARLSGYSGTATARVVVGR